MLYAPSQDNTPQGAGASLAMLPTIAGTGTGGSAGSEFESQLFKHGRLRRLGPLDEEQVRAWGCRGPGPAHCAHGLAVLGQKCCALRGSHLCTGLCSCTSVHDALAHGSILRLHTGAFCGVPEAAQCSCALSGGERTQGAVGLHLAMCVCTCYASAP